MTAPLPRKAGGSAARFVCALALAAAASVNAEVLTVTADRDSTLIEDATGALANGAGDRLFTGETLQFGSRRALVHFDLSGIPAGSVVTSVVLQLDMDMTRTGAASVAMHRLSAGWGEGASASSGGGGVPATPGDATWLHRFHSSTLWSNPGGDFDSTPAATVSVVAPGTYAWGSTPALVADVQGWIGDPASNFGWILIGDEAARSTKSYLSRESGSNGPRLTIVYAPVPEPSTYAILAVGLAVLAIATSRAPRRPHR